MATVFDTLMGSHGFESLLEVHGESITFTPKGGSARTISVVVDRNPPAIFNPAGDAVVPSVMVHAIEDGTTGIAATSVNTSGDTVSIAITKGASATTQSVTHLNHAENGITTIAVM